MRRRRVFLSLCMLAWIAGSVLGTVSTERPAAAERRPLVVMEQAHAGYVPALDGTEPIFILFIGSDARSDDPVDRSRADSLHLVAVNPAKQKAAILGIPRDSYVAIPGYGSNKINAALVNGGPELAVATVEALTGITIDYWVLTGFAGFGAMFDQIGGLTIDIPFALNDAASRAYFQPGVQRLDGDEVLAFSRDRHDLPRGDFGRSENHGCVFIATLGQFRAEFRKDPSRLFAYVGAGLRNVQTAVPFDQVLSLAFTALTVNPKTVQNMVLPGTMSMQGGFSVVSIAPQAQAIYEDMAKDGLVSKKNFPESPNATLLEEGDTPGPGGSC